MILIPLVKLKQLIAMFMWYLFLQCSWRLQTSPFIMLSYGTTIQLNTRGGSAIINHLQLLICSPSYRTSTLCPAQVLIVSVNQDRQLCCHMFLQVSVFVMPRHVPWYKTSHSDLMVMKNQTTIGALLLSSRLVRTQPLACRMQMPSDRK